MVAASLNAHRFAELAAQADTLLDQGRHGVVARLLPALDSLRPGDAALAVLWARLHLARNQPRLARAILQSAACSPNDQVPIDLLHAKASLALADYPAAAAQARRVTAARPDTPDGWGILGLALLELNQAEQAGAAFAAGLAHHPNEAGLRHGAAVAARRLAGTVAA